MGQAQSTKPGSMLVTGVSTGIGRSIALHYAEKGWTVYGTVRKKEDGLNLQKDCNNIKFLVMDVTNEASIKAAVAQLEGELGPAGLTVLVNNAGIGGIGPLELSSTEVFKKVFEVNVFGVAAVTRNCLPLLRKARAAGASPRIIMMSSVAGRISTALGAVYCSSKWALEALCDTLRLELAAQGIKTVAIEPGYVRTAIADKLNDSGISIISSCNSSTTSELYENWMKESIRNVELSFKYSAIPMSEVLVEVDKAVALPRPAARYVVSAQMRFAVWLRSCVSDLTWDWLFTYLDATDRRRLKQLHARQVAKAKAA
mmetsp:Transcript_5078/g.11031  ORF Transcript_5078/g.11031 Transcript_5078/m.11031 type:complete len:314 (-) Transcript_5078:914-1855(-)|eukprot:CAMPEP_0202917842 /NCGR_PEP_ID=MMETSP1392-20130828/71984_1 /ASSEMBLY_ACC=CAM_ASM_000868 /TAXON_ID=225041 /ORGANISM="Chlamydomonas chlamydogama, Strain SAG 11-48b" /LENGTH=313 /DNA_ID=CAMNT_0049610725 /DNA_START=106 /DNA_END=1047 /DNA_ORIENTATION=+